MAGHHHAGDSLPAFLAERDRLVDSMLSIPDDGVVHAATIGALRRFLILFHEERSIPWVSIYQSALDWQNVLPTKQWDRDAVPKKAEVFFTLITPLNGAAISRGALGGGIWESKEARTIGNGVVLSKLYYKRDDQRGDRGKGSTVFEFHLAMDQQPRVAVCVLHRTGYRRCASDLKDYILEGSFPGRDKANLQVVQPAPPIYQDPHFGGLTNGPHVDQAPNPVSNSEMRQVKVVLPTVRRHRTKEDVLTSFDQPWIHTSASLDEPFVPFLFSENNSIPEGSFQGSDQANLQVLQPGPPIYQDPYFGGLTDGPHVDQTTIPVSNSETSFDQPWIYSSAYLDEPFGPLLFSENNPLPEPAGQSHADETSTQYYYYYPYGEF